MIACVTQKCCFSLLPQSKFVCSSALWRCQGFFDIVILTPLAQDASSRCPHSSLKKGKMRKGGPLPLSSVQSLSHVQLFATPWTTAALQAFLSITNSWSPSKPMSIVSVMPSNYLILCRPLLLLPSIFPSIRVFSNESALCIKWQKVLAFQLQHQFFQWTPRIDLL